MLEPTDVARVYLLVTAVEAHVEDGEASIAEALRKLHAEHAETTGDLLPALPDGALLRRESCGTRGACLTRCTPAVQRATPRWTGRSDCARHPAAVTTL